MRTRRKRKKFRLRRLAPSALFVFLLCGALFGVFHFHLIKSAQSTASPAPMKSQSQPQVHTIVPATTPQLATQTAPTLFTKTINVNQTQTQQGIKVTVKKVVFLQDVMSVVVEVQNRSTAEAAFHIHDTVATQGGQEFAWHPSQQTLLPAFTAPHATASGVITFQGINPQQPFALSLDVKVDQAATPFVPFLFQIKPA